MKSIDEIKKEIVELENSYPTSHSEQKAYKSAGKKVKLLRDIITYMELINPNESFINNQISDIERKLAVIDSGFDLWTQNVPRQHQGKKPIDTYRKEVGRSDLINQLHNLKYILTS